MVHMSCSSAVEGREVSGHVSMAGADWAAAGTFNVRLWRWPCRDPENSEITGRPKPARQGDSKGTGSKSSGGVAAAAGKSSTCRSGRWRRQRCRQQRKHESFGPHACALEEVIGNPRQGRKKNAGQAAPGDGRTG